MTESEDKTNLSTLDHKSNLTFMDSSGYEEEIESASKLLEMGYFQIIPIILFFGLVGNILNIFVFSRKCMKAPFYKYFQYLSIFDLLALTFWILVCISIKIKQVIVFQVFIYCYCIAISTSIMLFTAISIERYFIMCMPSYSRILKNSNFAHKMSVGIFLGNIIIFAIGILSFYLNDIGLIGLSVHAWVYFIITRLIPAIVIITVNIRMTIEFKKISKSQVNITKPEDIKKARRENRLIIILLVTAILYTICELPLLLYWITVFYNLYDTYTSSCLHILAAFLEKINFASSFYIYFFTINKFRHIILTPIRKKIKFFPQAETIDENTDSEEILVIENTELNRCTTETK